MRNRLPKPVGDSPDDPIDVDFIPICEECGIQERFYSYKCTGTDENDCYTFICQECYFGDK